MGALDDTRETLRVSASYADVDEGIDDRFNRRFLLALAGLLVASLWLRPMVSSLWVDETGSWWVVKDGIREAVSRSTTYQGQSPLYYLILWTTRVVGGRSEVVLRLPSLLFAGVAAFLLYRLAVRLVDPEFGLLAVVAFAGWPGIGFAASDARPYALAVLAVIASTLTLVEALDSGRRRAAVLYVFLAALVLYSHYLFGLVLVAHLAYAIVRVREGSTPVTRRGVVLTGAAIAVVAIPLGAQLLSLWSRRGSLTLQDQPSVQWLAFFLVPPAAVAALVLGGCVSALAGGISVRPRGLSRASWVLMLAWLIVPLGTLLTVSVLTPIRFLALRYTLSAAPAGALMFAWVVRSLRPRTARRIVAGLFAILSVLALGNPLKMAQDWRGAAAAVNVQADEHTVVFVHPAFIESTQLDWLTDPERRSYLLSPLSYYPMQGRVVLLPATFDDSSRGFVAEEARGVPDGTDRVLLVTNFGGAGFGPWLDGHLGAQGWTAQRVGDFGEIEITEFDRPAQP